MSGQFIALDYNAITAVAGMLGYSEGAEQGADLLYCITVMEDAAIKIMYNKQRRGQ